MALHAAVPIASARVSKTFTCPADRWNPIYGQNIVSEIEVVPFPNLDLLEEHGPAKYFGNPINFPFIKEGSNGRGYLVTGTYVHDV